MNEKRWKTKSGLVVIERWLRREGTHGQFHRFTEAARVSCCGMLHLDERPFAMETPGGFPQYFCRRCTDIKAAENRRKVETT